MKKILIFTHEFPPRLGGAGSVALGLAEYFTNMNYNVTVVTEKRQYNKVYKFTLIEIATIHKVWFISYYIFFKLHNLKQYDYIILNDAGSIYSAGLSFNINALNKSIVYVHGVEKYLQEENLFLKLLNFRKVYLNVFENCKKIITVSNFIKDLFFKDGLVQFLPKVQIIYNGVDTKQFYQVASNILNKYNISVDSIALLSVSRFTKEKGYLRKLKIFKKLLLKNHNLFWFIIGDGDFKEEFKTIIKKKELDKKFLY